jgi:hypothetical protein
MARGGKREGAGRPVAQHTIEAEAAKAALVEAFVKAKDKIFAALIKRAKTADIPAIKELFDRVWGKAEQPITGKNGKDLFPAPLLANLDVHNNNRNKENSDTVKTDTGSTGRNVSQQDGIDTLIPD